MFLVMSMHTFIAISFAHILRLCLYLIFCVYYQNVLGWLEARTRRDLTQFESRSSNDQQVAIKFLSIKYQKQIKEKDDGESQQEYELMARTSAPTTHFSANSTCSICCIDF